MIYKIRDKLNLKINDSKIGYYREKSKISLEKYR
jgi:bifunctional DNA-binding transcriptional regulator/antitoxin component of YhaV-PrlF toxin-antitoxin module